MFLPRPTLSHIDDHGTKMLAIAAAEVMQELATPCIALNALTSTLSATPHSRVVRRAQQAGK